MRRIALPLSLLLALTACGPEPSEQSDTVTIEFWTIALGDAFADYILGMISTYEEAHPGVKIKWVDVSGGEVAEKFLAALVGDTPPDLANIYDLPRFLQYDILVDMDQAVPALDKAKRLDNFWRGFGYFQGTNYVIPWYVGVTMLWYNKDLFQRAGLDPDRPPRTIDEMLAMGRQIYERTGKYGVSWRLHPSLVAPPWALLRMDGFWPLFDEGYNRTRINHPDAKAIFQKWVDAYRDGAVPPEALAAAHRDETNWFIEGRAAMLPFSGGWITRYFDKTFEQKVATAPMPRGALGLVPASNQVLVVPKASRHREIAVDFGLFVTNDENQLEFCRQVAILPSTKAAAADPYFRRPAATLADQANQLSAADIPNSFVMAPPDVVGWSRMEDILHEEFAKALARQQSVDEALARIEQKWNHLLRYQ
ncbi:MAG: sugar ABC transporter substrate-binding protein [Candidatus Latescibacteria bacterium]|jgi:putative chitobiose transport system substrate-binding protein|nr:sugar ABC transporter substrate-binding protein [Candidatus Latescibacterota bacterium]